MAIFYALHVLSVIGLIVLGANTFLVALVYLKHRHDNALDPPQVTDWPAVLVQLPIYNEQHVVERLIDAVAALDYPRDRLIVQLLDDSTDGTVTIAAAAVDRARQRGLNIKHVRRPKRTGYKAGALQHGLELNTAPFVAIFDADFIPEPDFLKRTIPAFLADDRLGIVQARWTHLNEEENLLTRSLSLAFNQHYLIEQTAQHRGGMISNFTGSAGVMRRAAIDDSGGWSARTLSEDLDLSYRMHLRGWGFLYLPDVTVPAEFPELMMSLKRQQERWAIGTTQCLLRLGPEMVSAPQVTFAQKLLALLRMGVYFVHPLLAVYALTALPLVWSGELGSTIWPILFGAATLGLPFQIVMAELQLGRSRWKRLTLLVPYVLMGFGLLVNNCLAVAQAFSKREQEFKRTPKFSAGRGWVASSYVLTMDITTLLELVLGVILVLTGVVAITRAPTTAPSLLVMGAGLLYVAGYSIVQTLAAAKMDSEGQTLLGLAD